MVCECVYVWKSRITWGCVLTAGPVIRPWTDNGVDQSSLGEAPEGPTDASGPLASVEECVYLSDSFEKTCL